MSECSSSANGTGVQVANSGQIISFGNNRIGGNGVDGAPTSTPGEL